ncbi:MAG: threonine--tRNA ligase, partial [Rickettsiales bacterium]|nr:threonine--tRNA ligase [Rickettsiales bacterium]
MVAITLPDGAVCKFSSGVTGFEIAKSISSSLAKSALAIKVNGELRDLTREIEADASIEIITPKSGDEALEIIRHDAAHIMAQAVQELFPKVQVTIGPAIENGFYYDFATHKPFEIGDLQKIENRMRQIVKRNEKLTREVWDRDKAIEFFESMGEEYKAEIISSIPAGEKITLYRQGNFIDLCRGPHAPSTSHIKYFKLMKLAGAYWRGDSDNEMLQRIYGTAWESQESLDNYLHFLEEAEKRDHRKLGREMDLFHIQEEATGSIFWHKKGWTIFRKIESYIRDKLEKNGYEEVKTPQMIDKTLWEKSGHWDKFRDHMFIAESEGRTLAIKPMNCPGHIEIFKTSLKSYRQLPLRMAEFGCCHRNESSGSLHGIMRVRAFTQDDAHIFCTREQVNAETVGFCNLLREVYEDFGFRDVKVKFSTRPDVRAGTDEIWDQSEKALEEAVKEAGLEYEIQPGEGAFYGPKLEFTLVDAIGREWQCGTLQADFILPERLDANYIASDGSKQRPVMLHRAILGSFERFIGILIENYAGKLPLWLSPLQIVVATITNESDEYARKVIKTLEGRGFLVLGDLSANKINYKIREHSLKKVPYILAIGKKEAEDGTVAVRTLGSGDQ